jgi:hypothetical protein
MILIGGCLQRIQATQHRDARLRAARSEELHLSVHALPSRWSRPRETRGTLASATLRPPLLRTACAQRDTAAEDSLHSAVAGHAHSMTASVGHVACCAASQPNRPNASDRPTCCSRRWAMPALGPISPACLAGRTAAIARMPTACGIARPSGRVRFRPDSDPLGRPRRCLHCRSYSGTRCPASRGRSWRSQTRGRRALK